MNNGTVSYDQEVGFMLTLPQDDKALDIFVSEVSFTIAVLCLPSASRYLHT
jgi:hypothetical protein